MLVWVVTIFFNNDFYVDNQIRPLKHYDTKEKCLNVAENYENLLGDTIWHGSFDGKLHKATVEAKCFPKEI